MKEAVKGQAPISMDALVQQTESSFTAGVLHFPLPTKFRMLQIEAFDGMKDPVDHRSGVHQNLYTYTEFHLHIQKLYFYIYKSERVTYCDEPLLVCWPSYMRMFSDVFSCTYTD